MIIAKELGFSGGNSNDKNETYEKINSVMENDIMNEYKEYLSKLYVVKLNNKMKTLLLMYRIPMMHKNLVESRLTIASPKSTLKPLSKYTSAIFKQFYIKKNLTWNKKISVYPK